LKAYVAKSPEVDEMLKAGLKEFGKIDILVNTAGLMAMVGVPFMESKPEMWEKDMAFTFMGR